ncbi:MAG: PucR family transcriptional regulator [Bacillota bacterium]|jgi:sugar diacid utilization regulator
MAVQNVVDELARIIRRPITVEDADGRLIAYSVHDEPVDVVRMETLLRKGASSATIDVLKQKGVYRAINSTPGIVRVPAIPEIGFTSRICAAIRGGSRVLGYLWVVDESPSIPPYVEESLRQTCRLLAAEILDRGAVAKEKQQTELIRDLTGGRETDQSSLYLRAKALGWYPEPPFQTIVVRSRVMAKPDTKEVLTREIEAYLSRERFFWVKGTDKDENVLVLSGYSLGPVSSLAKALEEKVQDYANGAVGIGTSGETFLHIHRSYEEASAAIGMGVRLNLRGPCFDYAALAPYELVSCMAHCKKMGDFGRNLVEKVIAYDALRDGDLFLTLEAYLDLYGKRKAAAKRLNIHPNTLDYRVKRIREITEVDFDDPNVRLVMHVWVKALRSAKVSQDASRTEVGYRDTGYASDRMSASFSGDKSKVWKER